MNYITHHLYTAKSYTDFALIGDNYDEIKVIKRTHGFDYFPKYVCVFHYQDKISSITILSLLLSF